LLHSLDQMHEAGVPDGPNLTFPRNLHEALARREALGTR
jgi:hypothetical protein